MLHEVVLTRNAKNELSAENVQIQGGHCQNFLPFDTNISCNHGYIR